MVFAASVRALLARYTGQTDVLLGTAIANRDVAELEGLIGMFVYVAAYAGTVAAENALLGHTRHYDLAALPRVTFTDPAVASVGLTEGEARAQGIEPLVATLPLEHVPRALAARDTRGFVRLLAHPETRKLIGAHIVAAEAGERYGFNRKQRGQDENRHNTGLIHLGATPEFYIK